MSVVIVNWNGADVLGTCIESLLGQETDRPLRIVVLDNASTDDSLQVLARFSPTVEIIRSTENLGFGRGNNAAFRQVSSEFVIFLNPDTKLVAPDAIDRMLAPLADPRIGAVGPRLLNADGSIQQSCSAVPTLAGTAAAVVGLPRLLSDDLRRRWTPVLWSHDRSSFTGWVGGACIAIRSVDYRRVGGFSERTFMYGEDLELGYRIRVLGMRVFYETGAEVVHYQDHSSRQRWSDAETAKLTAAGELEFLRQRYARPKAELARWVLWLGYAVRAVALRRLGRRLRAEVYEAMAQALRETRYDRHSVGAQRSSL
ncbi:glycosyltransferase family 2 protein [Patulibacter medicamentivorans]|uniref:glycosyltransferase family 2 protein n=1 Tax=Patulibacter medicamentivorans TaxID=1097667 RepID=UPI00147922C2|nr:glycosyltransferase family 2 protein [Patulibacter medicamentivorans]